jgi:hypothetical protein
LAKWLTRPVDEKPLRFREAFDLKFEREVFRLKSCYAILQCANALAMQGLLFWCRVATDTAESITVSVLLARVRIATPRMSLRP